MLSLSRDGARSKMGFWRYLFAPPSIRYGLLVKGYKCDSKAVNLTPEFSMFAPDEIRGLCQLPLLP